MTELSAVARRAVEAATGAGASDAEAYVSREAGRQVRVHGGEVESLSAATQTGVEFAPPPQPAEVEALAGLSDPSIAEWETPRAVDLALAVERTALESDPRLVGV